MFKNKNEKLILDEIENNIKKSDLVSFDIFDTLITRRTVTPLGIFSIMQNILLNDSNFINLPYVLRANFLEIRVETEKYLRDYNIRIFKLQDVNIFEIYNMIKQNYFLDEAQVEKLISLEIETEHKNIIPIEKNIKILKNLYNEGHKVILISDMYLPKEIIRSLLLTTDEIFKNIKIYVSNEFGKTKHFSDLYKAIKEIEQVEYKNWIHFGDNPIADVRNAKRLGIKSKQLIFEKNLRYEEKAIENNCDINKELLIGTSKICRLNNPNKSLTYKFGVSFAAPILYCYVDWILKQAKEIGTKTLYFIARDGYVLKAIADEIIKQENLSFKTKYIYGSRKAWRIPSTNNIKDFIYWTLDEYVARMNLEFLAKRFLITEEELKNYTNIKDSKKILTAQERKQVENLLLNDDNFIKKLIDINERKNKLLLEYLEQEIDFSEKNILFVDIFGSGKTQDLLAEIIKTKFDNNISMFYFNKIAAQKENNISKKFCYYATINNYHYGIELLCRNKEGQTLGYEKKENKVVPILENTNKDALERWGYEDYLQSFIDYTKIISGTKKANNIELSGIELYKNYLKYFLNNLDKETANVLGSIPYSDVGEEIYTECAPKYDLKFLFKTMFMRKKYASQISFGFISARRSSRILSFLLGKEDNTTLLQRIFSIRNGVDRCCKIVTIMGLKIKICKNRGK